MTKMETQEQLKERILESLALVQNGGMPILKFCQDFETIFNFDLDRSSLSERESRAYEELFDKVVWYSPFPDERVQIPNYIDEKAVLLAVKNAFAELVE